MSQKKLYVGINIQYPISQMILKGEKTIETRKYPIPKKYINQRLVIIETPGKSGAFKSRMIGFVTFGESFEYRTAEVFYRDTKLHCVTSDSVWKWKPGERKFGWVIMSVSPFPKVLPLQKRSGIKFSNGIKL